MTENRSQPNPGMVTQQTDQVVKIILAESKPVGARIEFEVYDRPFLAVSAYFIQFLEGVHVVDLRFEMVLQNEVHALRIRIEHYYRQGKSGFAQLNTFIRYRDRQHIDILPGQKAADLHTSGAIGIGFNNSDLANTGLQSLIEIPQIVIQRRHINFQHCTVRSQPEVAGNAFETKSAGALEQNSFMVKL